MRNILAPANLPLLLAVTVLWLLGQQVSVSAPVTAPKIVTLLLFLLLLVWFVVSVLGIAR